MSSLARYPLLVHREVDEWVSQHRSLARRADWLLAELAARGVAGRPKGVAGPAREVLDLPGQRWRRSGIGGFDHYAWWFEAGEAGLFPPASRVVRAVRQHDVIEPLTAGEPAEYVERSFETLDPLNDEQAAVVRSSARVRLAVGHPGTGKTGALLYAVLEEARHNPGSRLLYLTLSRGLAEDALLFLGGLPELDERVEVLTYGDLLAAWSSGDPRRRALSAITDEAEEAAFLGFLADQPRNELNPWQRAREALWAEVRAQIVGRALPFEFLARGQPACEQPFLSRETYRLRERELGVMAVNTAWRLAKRFVDSQPHASLQRQAWEVVERIRAGRLDHRLREIDGLVVDEIQDLTLLQLAVLVEATRRIGKLTSTAPCFIAAGDESQVVHPSGFDWGVCKDLLRERLGTDPEEFQLATNQRSPAPLVETSNRTATLYDELPKEYRPQARVEAEKTEATNGRVYLCQPAPDDSDLPTWLERLLEMPGSALVVCPGIEAGRLTPLLGEERFADLIYEPAVLKGLDRQYTVIWEASRALELLREEVRAARSRGDARPRYLAARRKIDEFRVAVSRSNETLVFLDGADTPPDPLLDALLRDGVVSEASPALLADTLALRGDDPLARTLEFFDEAVALLDVDLDRALRTLQRADGALANLLDPDHRRQSLGQRITARQRAASFLLAAARQVGHDQTSTREQTVERYARAADQLAEIEASYRELGQEARADQYDLLVERHAEAPPGAANLSQLLPDLMIRYLAAIDRLPRREQRAVVFAEPRVWRDELAEVEWTSTEYLRDYVAACEKLAAATSGQHDERFARERRELLARLLIRRGQCSEALAVLELLPEPPLAMLAACHEGRGDWAAAASLRERAGELDEALDDYRQAGDLSAASSLAERLGQSELAASLRTAADLIDELDALENLHAPGLSEPERRRLAERLRQAAERLIPRHARAGDRHRRS